MATDQQKATQVLERIRDYFMMLNQRASEVLQAYSKGGRK